MRSVTRATVIGLGCLLITLTLSLPALAQGSYVTSYQNFSAEWTEIDHEIGHTADLYDYSGLPVNAAGRIAARVGTTRRVGGDLDPGRGAQPAASSCLIPTRTCPSVDRAIPTEQFAESMTYSRGHR